ncbi:hypothetical protein GQ55_6G086700 [Panicum hallii var. hallii]|uniref:Uncharacterized protein n=1 Tax=Panicum hallii var. hallii TaxID=1504633 RepID=A0A2T7D5A0_9POAL|nr:hypothetical protein GQ55_6G086700 [Panicum hallii var. hallii]
MVAQLEHQFHLGRLSVQGLWFFCQKMIISLSAPLTSHRRGALASQGVRHE